MNDSVVVCICSEEYLGHYKVLFDSIKTYSPDTRQILYYLGKGQPKGFEGVININNWTTNYGDILTHICSLRARVVMDAFDRGYKKVIFLGAKLEFFQPIEPAFKLLDKYDAFAIPHILEPLPEDGKFPSNASVSFAGHLSTDYVGFKNTFQTHKFLMWQDEIMKTQCETTHQKYLDQSWLNFLPFFVDNVLIRKDLNTNVGYWNMIPRHLRKIKDKWVMINNSPLESFQYSGLDLNNPAGISRHQNRWIATGELLEFLKDYAKRVKEYK